MRVALVSTIVAVTTAAGAATPAAARQARPECPGADVRVTRDASQAHDAILCIVNAERAARALPTVALEPRLTAAADGHSDDMAARGYFDHVTPEGRTPADRVDATGYPYAFLYENIAVGQPTPRIVMTGWMQSPGHCRGILAPEPVHLGVGLAPRGRRGPAWTQLFALPQDTPPPSQDPAPADGCPYQRLSIAPGPARVLIVALRRTARRVTVAGLLEGEGAGRTILIEARRRGRVARKRTVTRGGGRFRTSIAAPRGRGRVTVTATAPAVAELYETGRARRRI